MTQQKYLVAGGAGFLGANLVRRLLADGAHVVIVDNFQTGRRRNLEALLSRQDVTVIEHDIIEPLPAAVTEGITGIFNLACAASPPHYQAQPVHTFRTSVWGNWNLAQVALQRGIRILFTSTSEVYGDPLVHPQPETYFGNVNPNGIRSCYDEGKRGAETLLCDLARTEGLQARIARIFNTYGPFMDYRDGRVVSNFLVQAIRNEGLTVYGDGSQTRSFCYVDDLVEGLVRLFHADERCQATPVNIGNPNEFTIRELVTETEKLAGEALQIEYHPLPSDDPRKRRPDLARAREFLGWEPQVALAEGLASTIEYFRSELAEITNF